MMNKFCSSVSLSQLSKYRTTFMKNKQNEIIQNSLSLNGLESVSQRREYMQSHNNFFSHTLDPELDVCDQKGSGRCWIFALLNVVRFELIKKYKLPTDFELSQSYLCFYEKIEKCNQFLTFFMDKDEIQYTNENVKIILNNGCSDGGNWISCANLIKKYGVIPKSVYNESFNSSNTDDMNKIINYKLREYALLLTNEKNLKKRHTMKNEMMSSLYDILCKMLGSPQQPNDTFVWEYSERLDYTDMIERETKRTKLEDGFSTYQTKKVIKTTPIEFYKKFVPVDLDDYILLGNDPRNEYLKYYQRSHTDIVVESETNGFFNVPMEIMTALCTRSIIQNTPVEFDCDISQYIHHTEELMDNKCFNYDLLFNTPFNKLTKSERIKLFESSAIHAMTIVGVDLNEDTLKPKKWKVENSWGYENNGGCYTMTQEWFEEFGYNVVIHKQFVDNKIMKLYTKAKNNPVKLPMFDPMS